MKNNLIIFLSFVLVVTAATAIVGSGRWNVSSTKAGITLDNSDYFPDFIPYLSTNPKPLVIKTPNGNIDPINFTDLQATGFHNDYLPLSNRLYIIQYKSTRSVEDYMDVRPVGVLDSNTYIFGARVNELKKLIQDEDVNFIADYHPHYKLSQEVIDAYYKLEILPETKLLLTFSPFALPQEIQGITKSNGSAVSKAESGQLYTISGITDRQQLFDYASNPLITEIRFANN